MVGARAGVVSGGVVGAPGALPRALPRRSGLFSGETWTFHLYLHGLRFHFGDK